MGIDHRNKAVKKFVSDTPRKTSICHNSTTTKFIFSKLQDSRQLELKLTADVHGVISPRALDR